MELSHGCFRALGPSWVRDVSKTPPGASLLEPLWRCLGIPSWRGTAWLTPWWLSMLGFELSLPRGGGVWAAQCLNSLMTAPGHCPCPRPPQPRQETMGLELRGSCKALPCPCTKRGRLSLGHQWGLAKGPNDSGAGMRAVKVKHPPASSRGPICQASSCSF